MREEKEVCEREREVMRRSSQMKSKLTRCRRRRNIQAEPPQNLAAEADEAEICKGQGRRFFGCYLLTSLSPRYKGHSYIGFTVNPKRRIRQHNGEITSGASHTRMKRPWEMVFCIHGFPTHVAALQFEWAWQHPRESLAVRETASTFKSLGGLANKIKLSLTMLTLPSWQSMDLTVSFFSTKYMNHTAGCPSLPRQMKLHFCSMDELPCYWQGDHPYGCGDQDDIDSNPTEEIDDIGRFTIQDEIVDDLTVEEDEGHLQSLATDFDIGNSTNEHVQVAKETSTKEQIESFHQADSSEKESSSDRALDEDMGLHRQCLADMNEHMFEVPVDKVDPSEEESSSTFLYKSALKDDMSCILMNESTKECRRPMYKQLPVRVGDDVWPSSEGIEIIDLFTPSPECRIISGGKKRKAAHDHTDIIDLTRSPLFVQL